MAATAMDHDGGDDVVTPGELLGNSLTLAAGRGAYADGRSVRASVTGRRRIVPPAPGSDDQRSTVEVVGHKAHGAVPQPGSVVIARVRCSEILGIIWLEVGRCMCLKVRAITLVVVYRLSLLQVTKVMARMASADIMCVDSKAIREKFTGMIRQQDVRATEIDKVDMYQSYRPGDIVKAMVVSLIDENDAVQIISVFFSCYQPWLGLLALRLSTSTFLSCRNFLNL
ncbi:Nucleic acid-binding OB-fold-like protein [Zea mays]|uniref:Nucleic acid-binding OB-fold-like protein n=1 Tax=Zea mays TaxID=4577 RepID=A0A1D6HP97_MAIZE|nr:Nucleic acid-binding OB-fold-like protein [Zea mays]